LAASSGIPVLVANQIGKKQAIPPSSFTTQQSLILQAINLHGLVEIIEWPGGEAAHARIFLGPQLFGPQSDLEPVVLRFADLNGDHLPDMIIEVEGSQIVFINARGTFRPLQSNEQNQVMQALQGLGQ
jgi:hypothetical protein